MKILVTGGTGMIGSAFREIKTPHELILVGSKDFDLLDKSQVENMFLLHRPDAVIHLAARVGGVKGNMRYVADFFEENIAINSNVLSVARVHSLNHNPDLKVLSLLSTCIYPDKVKYPLTVDQIHYGPPHESNFGYAYAKRMLDVHAKAIRSQYGLKWISAVPNNVYGENDNFSYENSHVIPALIRKIYEGKLKGNKVTLWGDGSPLREFTYSSDIAEVLLWMIENYDKEEPLNIGTDEEVSIKEISEIICDFFDYPRDMIEWDISQPKGQFKKPSSCEKLNELNPEYEFTSLKEGIRKTCMWFSENYPNIRSK